MSLLYNYQGKLYPEYLKHGNVMQFVEPIAKHFCQGKGLDIGAGKWPFPGAVAIDTHTEFNAYNLPLGIWDYVFSSHCLEHLDDYITALEHWKTRIRIGGVLFLYLPHPDMIYWRPQFCRKHRHSFTPGHTRQLLMDLGFYDVLCSERDMAWSFTVVGFK